ncbi:Alpha/Beta hydrolase protein [Xylaria sp. CBS 124048]|nr:Alpha/Beta hydrolase protein [Xylaria sp. CBS 124048]
MAPLWRWGSALIALASSIVVVQADLSTGDYYVHELPGAPEGDSIKMHAGHIEVTPEHNGNLFFWHFQNKHIADRQRTIIWLNGGPGCSSEDGAMMEIGPYRMKDADNLQYNPGSWHEFANLLFVDNPVGTGYSYVDTNSYVHELDEMADQFVIFLEKWFSLFPEYEHDDIYLAGESYAGQHIPYIARAMLDRNKRSDISTPWNLEGLLIGNGWISPNEQYEAYLTFAFERGIVQKDSDLAVKLQGQLRTCRNEMALSTSSKVDNRACEQILSDMLRLTQTKGDDGQNRCINMYDVRLTDTYPSCGMNWPPDLQYVTPYLRKPEVVSALHINPSKNTGWTECNSAVGNEFYAKTSQPSVVLLPGLLEEIKVLLFSGAEDLICNHKGTEALISNLEWNGAKGFEVAPGNWAPRLPWTFEGEDAGFWQEARNLTYVLFNSSSHMVPFDYPRRTREMLDRFTGVDISSIGGTPSESKLDGEILPETTVSGVNQTGPNNDEEVKAAKWAAYQKSGEVVLAIVAIGAAIWGFIIWRSRRRTAGYRGLPFMGDRNGGVGFGRSRNRLDGDDIEAVDFDETRLADLQPPSRPDMERDHYSVGEASDDESDVEKGASGQKPLTRKP